MNKKSVILVLVILVLTSFSTITFVSPPASASPPLTGDHAISSVTLSTNRIEVQSGSSKSYHITFPDPGNVSVYANMTDGEGNSATSNTVGQTINPAAAPSSPEMRSSNGSISFTTALSVTVSSSQNPTDVGYSATLTADATGGVTPYT